MGAGFGRRRLAQRLQEIRAEGAGVLKVAVVTERDAVPLLAAAAAGNPEAQRRVMAVEDFVKQMKPWTTCLLCPAEISRAAMPAAVVLLSGHREGDRKFAAAGVCVDCAAKEDFRDRLAEEYRRLIPGLRRLPPFASAGQA